MTAMSPVLSEEFVDKERVYAKDQPQYKPLPVIKRPDGILLSRWRLTDAERKALINGADILLFNWTFNQPLQPVLMEVAEVDRSLLNVAEFMGLI